MKTPLTRKVQQHSKIEGIIRTYLVHYRGILVYGLIGIPVFLIYYFTLILFVHIFDLQYLVAAAIAFCIATATNYALNKLFNFRNRSTKIMRQFGTFFIVALVGLIANEVLLYMFVEGVGLHYTVGSVVALVFVAPVSFFLHKRVSFSRMND